MCSEADKMAAKQRYMTGGISLRALSRETSIPSSMIEKWNREEGWAKEKASIENQAKKKTAAEAVDKKARELCKLLEASDELEKALLLAARTLSRYLEGSEGDEAMKDKKTWVDSLNHIVAAIGKQAETRMMLSGILAKDEEEKIDLMRRKQTLEERRERQDVLGGLAITLDKETEELAQ